MREIVISREITPDARVVFETLTCVQCGGTGEEQLAWEDEHELWPCPHCEGSGLIILSYRYTPFCLKIEKERLN